MYECLITKNIDKILYFQTILQTSLVILIFLSEYCTTSFIAPNKFIYLPIPNLLNLKTKSDDFKLE